jgi:hypothetical protein
MSINSGKKLPETSIQGLPIIRNKTMAQDNHEDGTQGQPKYLTHEDLNGALASQKKEFTKLMQQMQQQNQQLVETLQSTLGPKPEAAPLPSKSEMSDDIAEIKKQNKLLMDRLRQQEESEKRGKMESNLRNNLGKHGIASRADLAIKYLQDQVSYDEDGQLVMKFEEVTYPLAEAISKFAQTDQGKFLADPRDVRGSGANSFNSPKSQQKHVTEMITDHNGTPVFKDAKALKEYTAAQMGKSQLKF